MRRPAWCRAAVSEVVPRHGRHHHEIEPEGRGRACHLIGLRWVGRERERQALWSALGEKGLSDELVAMFEDRVEREPNDPDLRVELGSAYLQKVFEVGGSSPTAGMWAMKADAAFDAALALDENHWEARFSKAISYSFWPPALGMQNKAIAQFETLLQQQQSQPPSPQFAQTYYFLGNMYQQTGNPGKALQVWQQGLALYPGNDQLMAQLAAAQGK